jgi:solute carrier family 25 S-adenosylmethionine transporter 26
MVCPAEVVKQQLQAGKYDTSTQAGATIWKKQGIHGFYYGYIGALVRDVPF